MSKGSIPKLLTIVVIYTIRPYVVIREVIYRLCVCAFPAPALVTCKVQSNRLEASRDILC